MNEGANTVQQASQQVMRGERPVWVFPALIFAAIIVVLAGAAAPGLGLALFALLLFAGVIFEYVLWHQKEHGSSGQGVG